MVKTQNYTQKRVHFTVYKYTLILNTCKVYVHVCVCAYIYVYVYVCFSPLELGTLDLWEKPFFMQTNILPYGAHVVKLGASLLTLNM